ncbi:hypothetical protein B0T22DRAFT_185437 [Podospora appendiculata]|uniref:Uncharacterized protein n=1 Tax=Podospora appendiculata TaxID=314037 RepID=A0AAE0XCC8_9PEZI|nr:hypothetical protein B0T22DRAFT_185437 [Podospora appendiculata]
MLQLHSRCRRPWMRPWMRPHVSNMWFHNATVLSVDSSTVYSGRRQRPCHHIWRWGVSRVWSDDVLMRSELSGTECFGLVWAGVIFPPLLFRALHYTCVQYVYAADKHLSSLPLMDLLVGAWRHLVGRCSNCLLNLSRDPGTKKPISSLHRCSTYTWSLEWPASPSCHSKWPVVRIILPALHIRWYTVRNETEAGAERLNEQHCRL